MLTGKDFIRYNRQIMLEEIGEQGQELLKNSTALVIGLGGLGCPVSLYLAAAGIGKVILLDDDLVARDNLHRQILYSEDQVGQKKVSAAKNRLEELNSGIDIEASEIRASEETLPEYLEKADVILDCTDNVESRLLINRLSYENRKALIIGAAIRFEAQVISFDYSDKQSGCYQCLIEQIDNEAFNCSTAGVLGPILGIAGSMQALSAIKFLSKNNFVSNLWQCFDGRSQNWLSIKHKGKTDCPVCGN